MPLAYTNEARDHATVSAPSVLSFRRFGVELEMLAPDGTLGPQRHASDILTGLGIANEQAGAFGRNYHVWQCKHDGSLSPSHRGVEIVSRIMPANRLPACDEIKRVANAVESAGFKVNRSCGIHVHINVADLPFHVRQLIVLRYAHLRSEIDSMLPPSRRTGANGFCQTMMDSARTQLAQYIDTGLDRWPVMAMSGQRPYDHYSATNVQHTSAAGSSRIEFRQAAASVSADKIIGWIRFLQEFVTEVARRAQGLTFGRPVTSVSAWHANPRPQTFGGRIPHMRYGSDNERAMTQLRTAGVITTPWARDIGIAPNVLRRVIVGFRRHGAGIITQRTSDGPSYVLAGANVLPVPLAQVFAGTTIQPAVAPPAPVAPSMPDPVTTTRAAEFVAYPFDAGLTESTREWCAARRATFAAR